MSKIAEFYSGRTILITGATGFMGKVLLERILCTLPDIKRIYIFLRPKRGLSPQERIKSVLSKEPFTFNNIPESQFAKVSAITGDLNSETLDLSEEDCAKIINEVSVVIHLAAVVKFDLTLKDAFVQNTMGTKYILTLCTRIKNLVSVVYVSTTYCNTDVKHCEERVYKISQNYIAVKQVVQSNMTEHLQDDIIAPHPNTYTFTKRLTEIVANEMGEFLPLSIVRPSIVIPAFKKPTPGWVDTLNGPMGLFSAGGLGIARIGIVNKSIKPDLVPVDVAINGIIVAAYAKTLQKTDKTLVYNLTLPPEKKVTWKYIMDILTALSREYPFEKMIWYPRTLSTTNYKIYLMGVFILQVLPAMMLDTLIILCRQKPFLINIQKRIYHGMKLTSYFSTTRFSFETKHTEELFNQLSPEDKKIFYGIHDVILDAEYLKSATFGAQKYVFKDNGTGKLRYIKLHIFFILDLLLHSTMAYWILRYVLRYFNATHFITPSYWFG